MVDADYVRLGRVAGKLVAARAMPVLPRAFGVEEHGFKLGAPLPEAVVAEFEERHEVMLPPAYRLFVTELGDGGGGAGYGLPRLSAWCRSECQPGHLALPSPHLPGPRYPYDWQEQGRAAPPVMVSDGRASRTGARMPVAPDPGMTAGVAAGRYAGATIEPQDRSPAAGDDLDHRMRSRLPREQA